MEEKKAKKIKNIQKVYYKYDLEKYLELLYKLFINNLIIFFIYIEIPRILVINKKFFFSISFLLINISNIYNIKYLR